MVNEATKEKKIDIFQSYLNRNEDEEKDNPISVFKKSGMYDYKTSLASYMILCNKFQKENIIFI